VKKTKLPFKFTEVTLDRSSAAEYLSEVEKYRFVQEGCLKATSTGC
jgi:hypothetical protein